MTLALLGLLTLAPQSQELRQAVEKSLPYIEKKGVDWIANRKCASCHHVPFMIWSHREALDRGFAVDPKELDDWTRWAVEFSLNAKTEEGRRNGGGLDTMAQLILARPPKAEDKPYRELSDLILGMQKPQGYWPAGGQLPSQRRAPQESDETSTLWVLHAFRSLDPGGESWKESREKAAKWAGERRPGKSNESLALHLLTTRSDALLKELLARQKDDGGWSWLSGEASDALATGQNLYVLNRVGVKPDAEPVRRATQFLIRTQRDDGSWLVRSTKPKSKDVAISSYWGTAWAAIGLLRSLAK